MSHHRIAVLVVAVALVLVAADGLAFAGVEHITPWHGVYCVWMTAITVGGDVAPTGAGYLCLALAPFPLVAAAFSLFTSALGSVHVRREVGAAEQRLTKEADGRHLLMQRHVERLLNGHAVAADGPARGGAGGNPAAAGLDADGPVVPPPAAKKIEIIPLEAKGIGTEKRRRM